MTIRPIRDSELPLLTEFLYEAIFQPEGARLAPRTIIQQPSIWIYIDGFGAKKDDLCVVAEVDGVVVGAAWARRIKGFGHIDNETPELAISVYPEYRGAGIGSALMRGLLEALKKKGLKRASLSVQKENPAVRFYRRLGFTVYSENDEDYLMVFDLL